MSHGAEKTFGIARAAARRSQVFADRSKRSNWEASRYELDAAPGAVRLGTLGR
jgi:hypothetical protein